MVIICLPLVYNQHPHFSLGAHSPFNCKKKFKAPLMLMLIFELLLNSYQGSNRSTYILINVGYVSTMVQGGPNNVFFKSGPFSASFYLFSSFQYS